MARELKTKYSIIYPKRTKNTKKLFRFCQEQVEVFGLDAIELVGSHDWYLGADSIILTAL